MYCQEEDYNKKIDEVFRVLESIKSKLEATELSHLKEKDD